MKGEAPAAESWFSEATRRQPEAAVSWVARGISRSQQGKDDLAANDFRYAATLYDHQGEAQTATQLRDAANRLTQPAAKEAPIAMPRLRGGRQSAPPAA